MNQVPRNSGPSSDGIYPSGLLNAITDVEGIRVGHASVSDGDVQTGVTVVLPYLDGAENGLYFYGKYTRGANVEMTGYQVTDDFGLLSAPIFLCNLMSVGKIYNGALTYAFTRGSGLPTDGGWPPIVIGFDDRLLNDMTRRVLKENHALEAVANAMSGPVPEGNSGAGLGAVSFGFKGGIGTASRLVVDGDRSYTVGVLVLANYGSSDEIQSGSELNSIEIPFPSLLGVVATDAPLTSEALNGLASSAADGGELSLNRRPAGSYIFSSFSTGNVIREPNDGGDYKLSFVSDEIRKRLDQATRECTANAVLSALAQATAIRGAGGRRFETMPLSLMERLVRVRND